MLSTGVSALNTSALLITSTTNTSLSEDNPEVICTRASWSTVAIFMLANYAAHAATIQIFPGEKVFSQVIAMIMSLLYPGAGVMRGLNCIARGILVFHARFRRNTELQQAAAAGALCMVVRTKDWTPPSQFLVHGAKLSFSECSEPRSWKVYTPPWLQPPQFCEGWELFDGVPGIFEKYRTIHGALRKLPKGYAYMSVPPEAIVEPIVPSCTVHLAQSFSAAKTFVSIFQIIYSFYTLLHDSHYQIQYFGFAAFPLTVAPYAVMSIVNLLGGLLFPIYPAVFLVQSEVSVEVEQRHGKMFDGMVGSLELSEDNSAMFMMQDQGTEHVHSAVILGPKAPDNNVVDDLAVSIPTFPPFQRLEPLLSGPILSPVLRRVSLGLQYFRYIYRPDVLLTFLILTFRARKPLPIDDTRNAILSFLSDIFTIGVPLAVIGGLSGFKAGRTPVAQACLLMVWFEFGAGIGPFIFSTLSMSGTYQKWFYKIVFLYSVPAIGGFVVVAHMIAAYGNCKRV